MKSALRMGKLAKSGGLIARSSSYRSARRSSTSSVVVAFAKKAALPGRSILQSFLGVPYATHISNAISLEVF